MTLRPQTTAALVLKYLWLRASELGDAPVPLRDLASELKAFQETRPHVRLYDFPERDASHAPYLRQDLQYLRDLQLIDQATANPSFKLTSLGAYFGELFSAPKSLKEHAEWVASQPGGTMRPAID